MKVLITGNLGYVGPGLVRELRQYHPSAYLIGYDIGYFAHCTTRNQFNSDALLNEQHYGDVRQFPEELLEGVDVVISLAAISNDPMGNQFEESTLEINYQANINIAKMAKRQGVKKFILASSCSVYGSGGDTPRNESATLDPLTAYAKSKVLSEEALYTLSDANFQVTCPRFATACGMSERLRLDLVLNDFVATALFTGKIHILSDGTPWRPLIHVLDMARAIRWAVERDNENGGTFAIVNTGSKGWNFQVKDLAMQTQKLMPNVEISINPNAQPDKRSYQVNFDLFKALAPNHQPCYTLQRTVKSLVAGLNSIHYCDSDYPRAGLIRLNVIKDLLARQEMDHQLYLLAHAV